MVARTDPVEPVRAVIEQAASWQAQLADEGCSDADRDAFAVWLNADTTHRTAFHRMAAIAGRASRQDPVERAALRAMLSQRSRRTGMLALLLAGATTLGWFAADDPGIRSRIADEQTRIGELRSASLRTGDRITLDSDSAADIAEDGRSVALWRGGVMAKVRAGLAQPFVIHTPQGSARALGTQFSVRVTGDHSVVTVIESRVEACATQGTRSCLIVSAGQSARLDAAGPHRLADIDSASEAAWSDGLLVADDRPLATVLDELNRYRRDPIRYPATDLEGLRITGTFPLTDTDRALVSIGTALPVTIDHEPGGPVVRRR
jgi:transmembrane sensor